MAKFCLFRKSAIFIRSLLVKTFFSSTISGLSCHRRRVIQYSSAKAEKCFLLSLVFLGAYHLHGPSLIRQHLQIRFFNPPVVDQIRLIQQQNERNPSIRKLNIRFGHVWFSIRSILNALWRLLKRAELFVDLSRAFQRRRTSAICHQQITRHPSRVIHQHSVKFIEIRDVPNRHHHTLVSNSDCLLRNLHTDSRPIPLFLGIVPESGRQASLAHSMRAEYADFLRHHKFCEELRELFAASDIRKAHDNSFHFEPPHLPRIRQLDFQQRIAKPRMLFIRARPVLQHAKVVTTHRRTVPAVTVVRRIAIVNLAFLNGLRERAAFSDTLLQPGSGNRKGHLEMPPARRTRDLHQRRLLSVNIRHLIGTVFRIPRNAILVPPFWRFRNPHRNILVVVEHLSPPSELLYALRSNPSQPASLLCITSLLGRIRQHAFEPASWVDLGPLTSAALRLPTRHNLRRDCLTLSTHRSKVMMGR